MLRVVASLAVLPPLLVVLLAWTMDILGGKLGSLNVETFELGMLPLAILISLAMLVVFVPLLLLTSRLTRISPWNSAAIGLLSALLLVIFSKWSFLVDGKLRLGFRMERLADNYPWLAMGAVGGLLFWLLAIFRNRALDQQRGKRS
jgi:cytochrome c biogenesis protein CcdA